MNCTIEADPDIAGIGVRAAVYAQAFFCILPSVLLAIFAPEPDRNYVAVAQETYIQGRATVAAMLVTNVALVVVSLYQASAGLLTGYHAALILNLSWIVFLGALLSSITLAYSHPLRNQPGFIAWLRLVLVPVIQRKRERLIAEMYRNQSAIWSLFQSPVRWSRVLHTDQHFVFLSIHIIGTGILGVFLFGNFDAFGRRIDCQNDVVLWTFTFLVPISSLTIQHVWFAIYVVSLIPVVNIVICAFIMVIPALILWVALAILGYMTRKLDSGRLPRAVMRLVIVLPFLVIIVFLIVATEMTILKNTSSHAVGPEESMWGFGQILAIVLMVMPAIETVMRAFAICTVGLVAFPEFPAREAERRADQYRQYARVLATNIRDTWTAGPPNVLPVTRRDQFTLEIGTARLYEVPVVRSTARIENATPEQVLTVLVCTGMRKQWDAALAFDGVLKRYDADTTQRYAVMNPEPLSTSAHIKPRDFVLVQQVDRDVAGGTITVTNTSMDPPTQLGLVMDALPRQSRRFRASLPFEGWILRPVANTADVEIECFAKPQLEKAIPRATARNMGQRSFLYPYKVQWTFENYGFAPVWGIPDLGPVALAAGAAAPLDPARRTVGIIEREYMEPETGEYTATFRAQEPGVVTVDYDVQERTQYFPGANAFWQLIAGDEREIAVTNDRHAGRLTLTVDGAGPILEVSVFRTKIDNM